MQISDHYIRSSKAKQLMRKWANNYDDPEFLVERRLVRGLTVSEKNEVLKKIRVVASHLWQAFNATDEYERDWFLTVARYRHALFACQSDAFIRSAIPDSMWDLGGFTPTARGTAMDNAIRHVQQKLVKKMAVCRRGRDCEGRFGPCFFRRRKGQKYCCKDCADTAYETIQGRYAAEIGNPRRRERRRAKEDR